MTNYNLDSNSIYSLRNNLRVRMWIRKSSELRLWCIYSILYIVIKNVIYFSRLYSRRRKYERWNKGIELLLRDAWKPVAILQVFGNARTERSGQETDSTCNRGENTFSGNALSGGFAYSGYVSDTLTGADRRLAALTVSPGWLVTAWLALHYHITCTCTCTRSSGIFVRYLCLA